MSNALNRRAVLAGGAALAATTVIPPVMALQSAGGPLALEFARLVAKCSPAQKIAFAADLRAWEGAPEAVRIMADVIDRWGQRESAGIMS